MKNSSIADSENNDWDLILQPRGSFFDLKFRDVYRYRFLLWLFVKRDFVAQYKQTILGPLWHFISPIFTTVTFMVIFGNIAKLSTDGTPQAVFYLSGITIWNFFSQSMTATSNTFITNAQIFGKVYFPRLIAPLSIVFSSMVQFGIQLLLLMSFVLYFKFTGGLDRMDWMNLIWLPGIVMLMAGFGLGVGIIISSMTTKYRDLKVLIGFGVNLLMYATPVIYPLSSIPDEYRNILAWNPIAPVVESFRYIFTGNGTFSPEGILYSTAVMLLFLVAGMLMFNRVEKTFMDTV